MLGTLCKNTHWKNTSLKIKVWKLLDTEHGKDMMCRGPHLKKYKVDLKMCQYSTVTLIPMNILEHLPHSGWVQPERESIPMMWLAWSTVLALKYSQIVSNVFVSNVSNVFVQITTCICPRSPLTVWPAWSTVLAFQRRRIHQKTTIHTMYLIHLV